MAAACQGRGGICGRGATDRAGTQGGATIFECHCAGGATGHIGGEGHARPVGRGGHRGPQRCGAGRLDYTLAVRDIEYIVDKIGRIVIALVRTLECQRMRAGRDGGRWCEHRNERRRAGRAVGTQTDTIQQHLDSRVSVRPLFDIEVESCNRVIGER